MPIELKANAGDAGQPLKHFWNFCVGAGRANEGLRADWHKAYKTLALGKPEQLKIELNGLKANAKILIETLDKQNGTALAVWTSLGEPENASREQLKLLRERAAATKCENFVTDASGSFKLQRAMEPWSVVSIREV